MKANISTRKKVWLTLVFVIVLTAFTALIDYPKIPESWPLSNFFNRFYPHLGLDLQGGTHLIYQADMNQIQSGDKASALEGVRDVIERRVNAFGVSEPIVQTASGNRLIVELAGVKDVGLAIKMIGETPLLEFKEEGAPQAAEQPSGSALDEINKYNEEAQKKAQDINKRALAGEGFAILAKENSEDPGSKNNGGDIGWQKKGALVPEYEKAIFSDLQKGQITPVPVKTQFGYHIIKKIDERGEGDNQEIQSSHILIATKTTETQPNQPEWLNTTLSGKHLKRADVQFDPNSGAPNVSLEFNTEGKDLFKALTEKNVGKRLAIFLDDQLISAPTVNEAISDGKAVITGNPSLAEAKLLAQRLNAGALPVPINLINQQTVGATLGKIYMEKSLLAGIIGLLAVAFFMIIYYRLPGLLSIIALGIYTIIALAIFEIWPVTLTLAGIAGFVLSIGMAVDANILIFERMKEELKLGKPLGFAIDEGFRRAWLSIRDSNFSSIITCVILAWFGSSIIKGFAITLAIGILVSMFSAITVTRTFLRLIGVQKLERSLWLFGVKNPTKATERKE